MDDELGMERRVRSVLLALSRHWEVGIGDARHSTAFEEADRRRRAELDRRIRDEGHCKFCRKKVADYVMEETPGVCGNRDCRRMARKAG